MNFSCLESWLLTQFGFLEHKGVSHWYDPEQVLSLKEAQAEIVKDKAIGAKMRIMGILLRC